MTQTPLSRSKGQGQGHRRRGHIVAAPAQLVSIVFSRQYAIITCPWNILQCHNTLATTAHKCKTNLHHSSIYIHSKHWHYALNNVNGDKFHAQIHNRTNDKCQISAATRLTTLHPFPRENFRDPLCDPLQTTSFEKFSLGDITWLTLSCACRHDWLKSWSISLIIILGYFNANWGYDGREISTKL